MLCLLQGPYQTCEEGGSLAKTFLGKNEKPYLKKQKEN